MPIATYLGGDVIPTQFSDTLQSGDPNDPNVGTLDGSKWIYACVPQQNANTPTDTATYSIGNSTKDGAAALLWSIIGAQNPQTNVSGFLIPVKIYAATYGKTQFCQATMVQATGVAGQGTLACGLSVLTNTANQNGEYCYDFRVSSDDRSWALQRFGVGAPAALASGAGMADGDVFRLSAVVSSSQVVLTVLRNGSQLTTFTDNTANRLSLGVPALINLRPVQGAGSPKSDWRTFSAGIGT